MPCTSVFLSETEHALSRYTSSHSGLPRARAALPPLRRYWGSHNLGHLRLGFCPCCSARGPRRRDLRDAGVPRALCATILVAAFSFVEVWTCTLGAATRGGARAWCFSRELRSGVVVVQPEARDCQESSLSSSCGASARNCARLVSVCWCGEKAGQILAYVNWGFYTGAEVRRDGTRWKNVFRAYIPGCQPYQLTIIRISLKRRTTRPYSIPPRCHIPHPHLPVPQRSTRCPSRHLRPSHGPARSRAPRRCSTAYRLASRSSRRGACC